MFGGEPDADRNTDFDVKTENVGYVTIKQEIPECEQDPDETYTESFKYNVGLKMKPEPMSNLPFYPNMCMHRISEIISQSHQSLAQSNKALAEDITS